MLLASIKRLIDRARDFLVGKIPDPKGQIDQITTALIYKYMDDLDQASTNLGGKPSFFVGDLARNAWHKLFDSKLSNQEKATLYTEGINKLSRATRLPPLFRDIFKDAFVSFRAPDTIAQFLNEINQFPPYQQNSEDIGNAFEYLLHFMGTQGDAGQFRTPRNIIDFIVKVVAPNKGEKILDPACGTAGFLVSAYKYIVGESKLTPKEKEKLANNIEGIDLDPQMAKFARVNLYLHEFSTPQIAEDDTLTNENLWGKRYNVILANPPFMTPKGGIQPHDRFGIMANRSEVLFVDYICEHLFLQGRAGVIVPEGIIFQSAKAYKELRKKLIEEWGLFAVVSLPTGVFNPYSGVKTSILFMDRGLSCDNILFVKVNNDGYDLGAKRQKIDKDDLPMALKIIQQWKKSQKISAEHKALAHSVSKQKITEDGECNLTGERYREVQNYSNAKWPVIELGKLCEIKTGKKNVNSGNPDGMYPFFTCAREHFYSNSYSFDTEALLIAGNGDVGEIKYYKGKFEAYQRTYVLHNFANVSPQYLYFLLSSQLKKTLFNQKLGNTMPYIKLGMLTSFKIPLPPMEVQEEIVAEIDGYQKVIDGAKQVIANWKPNIAVNSKWLMTTLNKACEEIFAGGDVPKDSFSKTKTNIYTIPIFSNGIKDKGLYGYTDIKKVSVPSVTISARGTIGYSEVRNGPFYPVIRLIVLTPKKGIADVSFLNYAIKNTDIESTGNSIPQLTVPMVREIKIPLPLIEEQKQIVAEIESEQQVINQCKVLVDKMEKKIADKIGEVWQTQ